MRLLAVIFGIVLIVLVALDAFETIVLPRRVTRRIRLATLFYRVTRFGWNLVAHLIRSSTRRDTFQGYIGPLSLLALLLFWAALFVLGSFRPGIWAVVAGIGASTGCLPPDQLPDLSLPERHDVFHARPG